MVQKNHTRNLNRLHSRSIRVLACISPGGIRTTWASADLTSVEPLSFSGPPAHARRMPKRPRHDWSRPLPLPLVIPEVMALQRLADVQTLMRHLPEDRRERSTWRHVAAQLEKAAL